MTFVWDTKKARANAVKHGIGFRKATFVFDDPNAFVMEDPDHSGEERRQWMIGDSGDGLLVVVYTVRPPGETIRIISARRANRQERIPYEENNRI
jgi:hypothetical protein